ncbi:MAG: dihydroorotase [Alphaproteobacteria bacterium RIFCSPLOWO2_01_FULL_40_26]|nr:MAG: dihydroorotase [Alphaproteobacteria bacterium RIFCSPHIGHO2_02_FULL_40_34]OFW86475.1 MAG: dihydroorotase [Alphaproteobacteria bacterium RIFCSPHIGHO2_01_FULL_40_8]OFW95317.1 MAG: dihydroorotase [Alphaproteobacteria bacterium RIFCSPLOWO2_01_FULL_40_26]OFX09220.1 MAG: dihydroorotase [Alphaproteobacteria bacterium RIFCSPLOWO2_02_FULL_40_19]OFX11575.1 MAG: dihydroorotase [Alphaproteobacteria bacterium RIFCSPLOWO2_12_FULL_40_11]
MPKFDLPYAQPIFSDKKILYKNARIIDPESGYDELGELLTIGDKIADFGKKISVTDAEIIDCKGHVLSPGLIDIQVHFRYPGQTHKEDLASGSMSAVAGGLTTVVCQPNTNPTIDTVEVLNDLHETARRVAYCNILSYACITKNMKGEELADLPALKKAGAVGFTDDGLPVMNAQLMRRAFENSRDLGVVIAQHAEDLNLTNKGCINEGEVSRKLGVRGIPNISESVIVERDVAILEAIGGHYHLLHVSTREALDAIRRAKEKGLSASVEVCPHHFLLTDEQILESGTNAKMNPPLRSKADRQALIEGLRSGLIDAISTDHAPHDIASKEKTLAEATFGIVGVETMLSLSLSLYHQKILSLKDLLAKMTCNAARIINFNGGVIKKGARADLTLIDLDCEWVIDPQKFHSKSKNSPFSGFKTKGRALMTVVAGKIVYNDF